MKKNPLLFPGLLAALALATWLLIPNPAGAQSTADSSDTLLPLLQAVTAQQAAITDNQTKIEASLAKVQENLRLAKIYAARVGKKASSS